MNNLTLNFPVNSVSFGQVSLAILREAVKEGLQTNQLPKLFPIGNVDLSSAPDAKELGHFLEKMISSAYSEHSRSNRVVKLWHINGAYESYGKEQDLITFHETDSLTSVEQNILRNQRKVYVTSSYTKDVFESYGLQNVEYLRLGFDNANFFRTGKKYYKDDTITFGLYGKFEHRKRTGKILNLWAKKYGNNPKYRLHCAVYNPFYVQNGNDYNNNLIAEALGGKKYDNIVFFNYLKTNAEYNDLLNSADIVLAFSGGEGLDLPVFHSVAMGKHCAGLHAHAYKDYLNEENACLVKPFAKIPCYDNFFFKEGGPFNQGFFFDFSENDFYSAIETSVARFRKEKVNTKGLALSAISYSDTWKQICQS